MRIVLQKVNHAKVSINNQVHGKIKRGFMLLVGVEDSDGQDDIDYLVHKISKMRIFKDDSGKMNNNLTSVNGSILSISQFTLYANTAKGNRPSFFDAGKPEHAKKIYDQFNHAFRDTGIKVETGIFGADMQVDLENDGPTTIILDTDNK